MPGCGCVHRDYLQRIISNLLRNALHYAGSYGPVHIRAEAREGETVISVRDRGPGVPEEDLPLLCEPFFRGRAASTHPGGTGLGLSIVKDCTESCGRTSGVRQHSPTGVRGTVALSLQTKERLVKGTLQSAVP